MHILIISDAYPPMRTSCATQIYDLAQAFIEQDHQVSIIIPAHSQKNVVEISTTDGPTVYSVRCFKTKDVGYARRTIAEFINPFIIGFHLKRNSHFISQKMDGITWYSPTIFWGPLVKQLKTFFNCKAYLILRDIFPEWAMDLGLIKSNLISTLLQNTARDQYDLADRIGVQSPGNIELLLSLYPLTSGKIEVLWNWMAEAKKKTCPIKIQDTTLTGRKIFIYAGNLGVAQDSMQLFNLVRTSVHNKSIGYIIVGRGSEMSRLQADCNLIGLENILFYDEIEPEELNDLLTQCHAGIVLLDPRHKSHNIPGKFLSYIGARLPIIAFTSKDSDLSRLIENNNLGIIINSADYDLNEYLINLNRFNNFDILIKIFNSQRASSQINNFFEGKS